MKESYDIIKYKYDAGVYTLKEIYSFVSTKSITEKEFHIITSYNYQGLKELKGW